MLHRYSLALVASFGLFVGAAGAQETAAAELLGRVPDGVGLCLVVSDLRGQLDRWSKTSWWPKLRENPLVRGLLEGKEVGDLLRLEGELKKHLNVDFAQLRDEIFGDGFVLAYLPPPRGEKIEKGLLLLKAKKAEALADLIDRLNEFQNNLGELTSLEVRKHGNKSYFRRVHQQATHYYFVEGPVLAASNDEAILRAILDRDPKAASPRREQWRAAGLTKAAAAMWLDPRVVEPELVAEAKKKVGHEAVLFESILDFWSGLDGVWVSLQGDDVLEARLTLATRPGTTAAKLLEPAAGPALTLWRHLPENALIRAAGPIDFAKTLKKLQRFIPEKDAAAFDVVLQKTLGAATGLDVYREVLPNLGPDVGFAAILPEGEAVPRAIAALAAKSAPADAPVDQMLVKAAHLFIGLAVFDYNRKNNDPIRLRTVDQSGVEVKYLVHDKLFPKGVQPALAIKSGFIVLASTPDAIAAFRPDASASPTGDEVPLVEISPRQWSRLIKAHRQTAIDHFVRKTGDAPEAAANIVDGLASGFEPFQSLTLTQRAGNGQSAWIVRLRPAP